jgi:hypothetical protein
VPGCQVAKGRAVLYNRVSQSAARILIL